MNSYNIFLCALILVFSTSCEEVVNVELEESPPRLVVEASVLWIKGSEGNFQQIKLSQTAPFYEEENPPVKNAEVNIISENGDVFNFEHSAEGIYRNDDFQPELDEEYSLEIIFQDELYIANESMASVPDIDFIEQTETGGFTGNEIEIKAYYTDPAGESNYYLFRFINRTATLEIYEDEFTDGNQIFGYYSNDDIEPGNEITISLAGISRAFYDYLFTLRSQLGSSEGPFQTQPATVKGNIINHTNTENYPFGYFRLSQVDTTTYIVE